MAFVQFLPLPRSKYKQFMKGCFLRNGTEGLTLRRNLNSFLGSVHFTGNVVAIRLNFLYTLREFLRVWYIWKLTLRVIAVLKFSTVVGHWSWEEWMCLEKWHWSYAAAVAYRRVSWTTWVCQRGQEGLLCPSHQDFTKRYVGQPYESILCSGVDFEPPVHVLDYMAEHAFLTTLLV